MISITPICSSDFEETCSLVGELLEEIIRMTGEQAFEFDESSSFRNMQEWIVDECYWIFVAKDNDRTVGFISLYKSHALYAGGQFGTIPELFVKKEYRSCGVGEKLLNAATQFAKQQGWTRLEVTTPPLPEFERTLTFYLKNNFEITGGRKLKRSV